ncbi:MAG TPA: alpha/beta hydrolase-fold protein [Longimicrobium sp.]|nr:alpha/beta hydrolase-fold protein [Longimicrobium sp.]
MGKGDAGRSKAARWTAAVALTAIGAAPIAAQERGYRLVPPPSAEAAARADSVVREIERIDPAVFDTATFRAASGVTLRYRLLPPVDARPGRRYPLVVVFHGSGEIGSDNLKQVDRFPKAWARPEIRRAYPAYVLVPQMPERSANYTAPPDAPGRASVPAPPLAAALEMVDSLRTALPVDGGRVYAIGFSMGGSSVWNAVALRPELFAAAIPIAGVPPAGKDAELARTPLWIIHGNRDDANPIAPDREVYPRLARIRGARVRFWEYDGGVHRVPPDLLASDAFPRWLWAHRK